MKNLSSTQKKDIVRIYQECLDILFDHKPHSVSILEKNNKIYVKAENIEYIFGDFVKKFSIVKQEQFKQSLVKSMKIYLQKWNKNISQNIKYTILEGSILDVSENLIEVNTLGITIMVPTKSFLKNDYPSINDNLFFAVENNFINRLNQPMIFLTRRGEVYLQSFVNSFINTDLVNVVRLGRIDEKCSIIVYSNKMDTSYQFTSSLNSYVSKYKEITNNEDLIFINALNNVEESVTNILSRITKLRGTIVCTADLTNTSINIHCLEVDYERLIGKRGEIPSLLSGIFKCRIHIYKKENAL